MRKLTSRHLTHFLRKNSMTEAEFIKKIQLLKQIKPRKDWVLLTKNRIFNLDSQADRERLSVISVFKSMVFQPRVAFASLMIFGLFIFVFSFAQSSLPGELLYPVKKMTERSQSVFVSEKEKPKVQLELTNKRLEELTKIAKENQVPKLAPAINEFQKSAAMAAKNLKGVQKITKEVVDETKKLLENKEKAEALGVVIGETEELDETLSALIESQITDLEKRTLTERQKEILQKAKESLEKGDLNQSLEKILELTPNSVQDIE